MLVAPRQRRTAFGPWSRRQFTSQSDWASFVETSGGIVAGLSGRYATALFDLAIEGQALDAVAASLATLVAQVADLPAKPLDAEGKCLARAVFFEARGEPLEGQLAVAQVIVRRAESGKYPSSVCGVIDQPRQFTFARRAMNTASADYRTAQAIALIAQAEHWLEIAPRAMSFHASHVKPSWGGMQRVARIGNHAFWEMMRYSSRFRADFNLLKMTCTQQQWWHPRAERLQLALHARPDRLGEVHAPAQLRPIYLCEVDRPSVQPDQPPLAVAREDDAVVQAGQGEAEGGGFADRGQVHYERAGGTGNSEGSRTL